MAPIEASVHAASSAFCWLAVTPGLVNTVGSLVLHLASTLNTKNAGKIPTCRLVICGDPSRGAGARPIGSQSNPIAHTSVTRVVELARFQMANGADGPALRLDGEGPSGTLTLGPIGGRGLARLRADSPVRKFGTALAAAAGYIARMRRRERMDLVGRLGEERPEPSTQTWWSPTAPPARCTPPATPARPPRAES